VRLSKSDSSLVGVIAPTPQIWELALARRRSSSAAALMAAIVLWVSSNLLPAADDRYPLTFANKCLSVTGPAIPSAPSPLLVW